jgi:hypothetical protein
MLVPRTSATDSGLWVPTPCASDSSNRQVSASVHVSASGLTKHIAPNGEKSQMRLSQHVKLWPTPTAHNAKETGAPSQMARDTVQLGDLMGGSLNPNWVEWLMGWPIGHTDLNPSETGKCLSVHLPPFVALNQCSERVQA